MYSKFAQRCLSLLMALAMVLSLTPLQTLATETKAPASTEAEENVPTEASEPAAEPEANPAVLQLQEAADTVLIRYLGSTTLSYEEIEAIVTSMEWETLQTARYDISVWEESLQAILDCGEATEVELQQLLNGNPDFVDFAEILEANNNVNLLSGETVTPITNVSVVANSDATASNSNGTVTVTVTSKVTTRKTGTVKIYNNSDSSATLSFDYSASNLDTEKDTTFKIDDKSKNGATESTASGSYSLLLDAGGYITVSFTAPRGLGNRKATLTLKNFNLVVAAAKSTVTLGTYDTSLGTATINGGTSGEGNTTTAVTLAATPKTGVTLLGWVNTETHEWIPTGSYYPTADCTLIPAFASAASTGWFSVSSGMYLYNDLNAAASHASSASNKTVILEGDGTLSDEHTIPSGVTLLIPFDSANTLITDNMGSNMNEEDTAPAKTLYRQLTMVAGSSISVNGAIAVGSRAYKLMVGQVGPYGAIVMDEGSSITIESGGRLYAYGYIFYGQGSGGTITAKSRSNIYETGFIMDYPGKTDYTQKLYDGGKFPMRAFTIRNVEVPLTYEAGAAENVFYSIWGTVIGKYPGYFSLLGTSNSHTFQLKDGAKLTKSYKDGRLYLVINGDAALNSLAMTLKISLFGDYPISSAETSGFPLPSGYDITLKSGKLTLGDNVIMTEGSRLTIDEDATLNIEGKNLYVIDGDNDEGTVSATDVHGTPYTQVTTDAVLDVNGTVIVSNGGLYTSAGNASITSSKGGGIIQFENATENVTKLQFRCGGIGELYNDIAVTSASLDNSDDTYTETAGTATATYKYLNGFWHKGTSCSGGTATCTQKAVCTTCGQEYGELLPHIDGDPVVEYAMLPTYKTEGSYTSTVSCANCGKEIRTETLTAPKVVQQAAIAASADSEIILDVKFWLPDTVTSVSVVQTCLASGVLGTEPVTYSIDEIKAGTAIGATVDDKGRYVFSRAVASGEMTCPITFTFKDGSGNIVQHRSGEVFSDSLERTVVDYAKLVLESENSTPEQKALITDLITYGGYAQTVFGVKTDELAYDQIDGFTKSDISTVTESNFPQTTTSGDSIGITKDTQQAFLPSAIYMRVYFTLDSGHDISEYTFTLTYEVNHVTKTKTVTAEDNKDGRYYVEIPNIASGYLDYMYKITVSSSSGTYEIHTSVLAYLWDLITNEKATDAKKNIAKAIYLYSVEASNFFGK